MKRLFIDELVNHVDEEVTIKGWVQNKRDMGQIAFVDIRDRTGIIQVVLGDDVKQPKLGPEYVVEVTGKVVKRGERYINKNIATGTIEMQVKEITVLRKSIDLPFEIRKSTVGINEEVRLKHRYLDIRTERMAKNLELRYRVTKFIRDFLDKEKFIEVETPTLTKGTPEGAREFLVPSRLHEGKFYVLPQSPQQFKQLLMVGGVDRYFQIARCYRDEDQRGDRQPEFTQLDIEMSFVTQEDIMDLNERLILAIIKKLAPHKKLTFKKLPRLTYAEAVDKYGSDRPDLRKNKDDDDELALAWVVDFPLFEKDKEGNLGSTHHPFTMPNAEDLDKLAKNPLDVRAYAYDIVLNGNEIGGGSIRIHDTDLQHKIFEILGIKEDMIRLKFGHLLDAFQYGAPPHGGIAWGLDRLVMVLADEANIREVMAFPKTGDARDPMMDAPSEIEVSRLKDAHIKLDVES